MHDLNPSGVSVWRVLLRLTAGVAIVLSLVSHSTAAQPDAEGEPAQRERAQVTSIPAARQADRVAIITVEGAIDRITAMSVRRRIEAAEQAGMDAMVFEVNSPGGELGAVLEISNEIKSSPISNTVAWVHPDAYSGGAIIALACREIVTSSPASFGDAFIVTFGGGELRALSPDERTKLLPPLIADVTDSARRSGYDEYLVQAIVSDGIELWWVENEQTGERLAINEQEYRMLFGEDPPRGKPMLAEVTGGVRTSPEPATDPDPAPEPGADIADADEQTGEEPGAGRQALPETPREDAGSVPDDDTAYRPASETLRDVQREFQSPERGAELALQNPSLRPEITPADRGEYRYIGYITDGSAAIVMRDDQMIYFGFSSGIINSDEELKSFFGAKELVRVNESITEKLVRFMVNPVVRGVLIVVLLIAVFVEMVMAGTGIAGAIALGALALLLGPSVMIGLSGWWEIIAIVVGILCLGVEAFVIPGFGIFGVVGFLALFGGLIGTFVSFGGTMSSPQMQKELVTGAVTVLLAFITAAIGWWLIIRNAQNLPIFGRLMLSGASGVGSQPKKTVLHAIDTEDGSIRVGDQGVTTTPLYPLGQAEINGEIEDVYAAFGHVERGVEVRVVKVGSMRIEVEPVDVQDAEGVDAPKAENA